MNKSLFAIIAICIVSFTAFSCTPQSPNSTSSDDSELNHTNSWGGKVGTLVSLLEDTNPNDTSNSWTIIAEGNQSAMEEASNKLITHPDDWKKLWTETYVGIDPKPDMPEVDFAKNKVIAIYLGMVRTGGHTLTIGSIELDKENTTVAIKHGKPGAGCMTTSAIEYPFLFATIARNTPEAINFITQTEEIPCE